MAWPHKVRCMNVCGKWFPPNCITCSLATLMPWNLGVYLSSAQKFGLYSFTFAFFTQIFQHSSSLTQHPIDQWRLYNIYNVSFHAFHADCYSISVIVSLWKAHVWKIPGVPLLSIHFMNFITVSLHCPVSKIKPQHFFFNIHTFPILTWVLMPNFQIVFLHLHSFFACWAYYSRINLQKISAVFPGLSFLK